jgi:hypothetical protein
VSSVVYAASCAGHQPNLRGFPALMIHVGQELSKFVAGGIPLDPFIELGATAYLSAGWSPTALRF